MKKILADNIIRHLGEPLKQQGNELIWQCPICMDRGKDNLKYNTAKNVLYCFANSNHARMILRKINNNYNKYNKKYLEYKIMPPKPAKVTATLTQKQITDFENYMYKCNKSLLLDKKLLKFLYEKRGITPTTVSMTKLGYDKAKQIWTIPTIRYSCNNFQVTGFEFRPKDLSKNGLYRTKGTPNGLAMINSYHGFIDTLCIIEGYFDGYALLQHLAEQKEDKYYHIITPSNGVQALLKYLSEIDYSKYKQFYLFIDNDDYWFKLLMNI